MINANALRRVRAGLETEGSVPAAPGMQADLVVEVAMKAIDRGEGGFRVYDAKDRQGEVVAVRR